MAVSVSAQTLTSRQKHLTTISALEAQRDLARLEPAMREALDAGVTINEIKEGFSQLYAYTGFPRAQSTGTEPLRTRGFSTLPPTFTSRIPRATSGWSRFLMCSI